MFEANSDIAFRSRDEMAAFQKKCLADHIAYCVAHSPYYQRLGLDTTSSLTDIPCTEKEDLEQFNDDFLAVDPTEIVDIVLSSGTSGIPTRVMYSEHDLQRLAYNEKQSLSGCGITAKDVALLTCTLDRCFVAGLAYFLGIRSIGAAAIRNGHGTLESHSIVIQRMAPTVVIGVPTFLSKLGYYMQKHGLDPQDTGISRLVCIGQSLRDEDLALLPLARDLEALWQAKAYSTYASSEIVSTFCECEAQQGGHLHPDLAIVEILDDQGQPVADGAVGEVVITPMAVTGMPLLRFKTGDISFLRSEPCACSRNSPRLGPILGRKKQMLKVRGTTLYPHTINTVLDGIPAVSEYYVTASSNPDSSDDITIHIALKDPAHIPEYLQDRLQAVLRVNPHLLFESEEDVRKHVFLPNSRKPIRFIDKRIKS